MSAYETHHAGKYLKAFKAVQDMIDVSFDPVKGHFDPKLPMKDVQVI